MNCTLHDELTENGTDIGEILTENEATPDIQNIDPLICGENQVADESRVLQEILINTLANTDTPIDLPFFVEEVAGLTYYGSFLEWDFTVSNMFKIPSLPTKKKASKVTCHRLLTADEMFEQKLKEEEEKILEEALSAVRNGQLSQRKAAKFYGIPQATVSDHNKTEN